MATSEHMTIALAELRAELEAVLERAGKLQNLIIGMEDFVGPPASLVKAAENGARPSIREGAVTVVRESGNRGWLLSDLANEMFKRGWLGGNKEGKPSKETLRQALHDLQKQGVLVAERQGDGQWAPSIWKLSDKMLSRPADLS